MVEKSTTEETTQNYSALLLYHNDDCGQPETYLWRGEAGSALQALENAARDLCRDSELDFASLWQFVEDHATPLAVWIGDIWTTCLWDNKQSLEDLQC